MSHHSHYLTKLFYPDEILLHFDRLVPDDIDNRTDITYIGIGLSGVAALAILLAAKRIKNVGYIRKDNGQAHSGIVIETNADDLYDSAWVFVDDVIDSGATRDRVMKMMDQEGYDAPMIGCFLYHGIEDGPRWLEGAEMMYTGV